LSDPGSELVLSVVTPWELSIKTKAGKLDGMKLLQNFEERERAAGFGHCAHYCGTGNPIGDASSSSQGSL
jgi:hypothetical protein